MRSTRRARPVSFEPEQVTGEDRGRRQLDGVLFASSYFSVITPQAGSQNVIFVASGYLTQPDLNRLGLIMTFVFPGYLSVDRNAVDPGWSRADGSIQ